MWKKMVHSTKDISTHLMNTVELLESFKVARFARQMLQLEMDRPVDRLPAPNTYQVLPYRRGV